MKKSSQNRQKQKDSVYCQEVRKLFDMHFIDLNQSKYLQAMYLKASGEKQAVYDQNAEKMLVRYTNGVALLNSINKSLLSIKSILHFFFWVFVINAVIALLYIIFA